MPSIAENSALLIRVAAIQEETGLQLDTFISEARSDIRGIKESLRRQGERVGKVEQRISITEEHQKTICPEHFKKLDTIQQHLSKIDDMLQEKEVAKAEKSGELRALRKYGGWVAAGVFAIFAMWKENIVIGLKAFWSAIGL